MKYLFGYFERSVGPAADVKELEYISALHQTAKELREDGTISATDVRIFLRSRYGIVVEKDDALDIVKGLAGTARLPLPVTEKKASRFVVFRKKKANTEVEMGQAPDVELTETKRKRLCCRNRKKQEDEPPEEENEAALMQTTNILKKMQTQKVDIRRSWNVLKSEPKPDIAKNVDDLVRYDLVQLMSILLIPTIRRLEQERFKERHAPAPRCPIPPVRNIWKLAKLGGYVLKIPYVWWQGVLHRRAVAIKKELHPKPTSLISDVLRVMLGALEEESKPISRSRMMGLAAELQDEKSTFTFRSHFPELKHAVVNEELIQDLLEKCGEDEAARDGHLIQSMMDAAGGEGVVLDERAFARALTADVHLWPAESEDDVTSTFYDVYGFSTVECNHFASMMTPEELLYCGHRTDSPWALASAPRRRSTIVRQDSDDSFHSALSVDELDLSDDQSKSRKDWKGIRMGKIPAYKPTASYIDFGSDAFRSLFMVVFLFLFYTMGAALAVMLINHFSVTKVSCTSSADNSYEEFGCKLIETIWNWLALAIILCTGGLVIIAPISLGNHQFTRSSKFIILSAVWLGVLVAAPLIEIFLVDYVGINVSDEWSAERSGKQYQVILTVYLLSAVPVGLEIFRGAVASIMPRSLVRRFALLRFLFLPSDIRRTSSVKRAATHKINSIIGNAHKLHRRAHRKARGQNTTDVTMLTFVLHGEKQEDCGGFLWTMWRTLWTQDVAKKEGVWCPSVLVIGQVIQVVITAFLIVVWIFGTQDAAEAAEESRANAIEEGGLLENTLLTWIPEDWMIYYSFYPGGLLTWLLVALLVSVYYPSTVATALKFRSGFFKSLHDPSFNKFRAFADLSYFNLGNMIYALFGSAALFFIIFAGALFLLFWPVTRDLMILVAAWGLGLAITCGAKMLITGCFRSKNFKGLYRRKPAAANFTYLAMEAWHIGLGGGVMLGRLTQILLASAFWIGRVDVPFLADDVEIFGYRFDMVANYYIADVLMHDAHRHPFLERLSAMYLMRLKYGEHFGSDAGAAWRRIFVLTLMPWLMKYRQGLDEDDDDDDLDDYFPFDDSPATEFQPGAVRFEGNTPWGANDET